MKKTLSLLLAVIMLMSVLAGCGGEKTPEATTPNAGGESTPVETTPR